MAVLRSAAVRKSLSIYSFCLASNVCSIYLFDVLMFLMKPVIVPSGVYVLLDGPIRFLPVTVRFALIFVFTLFLFAHVAAMAISVVYQYVQITSFTPLKRLFQVCCHRHGGGTVLHSVPFSGTEYETARGHGPYPFPYLYGT